MRRKPWAGETAPLPPRVNGQRVVSAIKLATIAAPAHRWVVILETAGETFTVCTVIYLDGVYEVSERDAPCTMYAEAVTAMVSRVGSLD